MIPLNGSQRSPVAHALSTGPAHQDERLEVTVVLRAQDAENLKAHASAIVAGASTPFSRTEYANAYGSSASDIEAVTTFAALHQLAVVSVEPAAHQIILSGTVQQFNWAFGVELKMFAHAGSTYRGRLGAIYLPPELADIVIAVLGLDNRMIAAPHFRVLAPEGNIRYSRTTNSSFYPTTLASLYDFPAGDGHGQTIAIIELGGGYRNADLQTYFAQLNIPMPNVSTVSVNHATNQPTGTLDGPDGEVMLDIEVAAAVAPKANIVVYFCPNTDAGFLNAITTAMHDTVNHPSIISISWGGPEDSWTTQALTVYDQAFQQAAIMGITVCVASGDNGSSDGETDGKNHVDFPASSPHVLACGGTNLQVQNGTILSETVWNHGAQGGASGGGISGFFGAVAYQSKVTVSGKPITMRGVPDVAGDADPSTGYRILVDGQSAVFGGTSAVAPLWAGLVARINSNLGKSIGMPHAVLYSHYKAFRDITRGSNGTFRATPGWDATTGLGSPSGRIAGLFT